MNDKDDGNRAGAAIALLRIDPHDELAKKTAIDCLSLEKPRTIRSSTVFLILGMHEEAVIFWEELRRWANDENKMVSMWSRRALKEIAEKAEKAK